MENFGASTGLDKPKLPLLQYLSLPWMLVLTFGGTVYMQINYNPLIVLNDNLELQCFAFDVRVCQPLEAIPNDFKWSTKQVCPTYIVYMYTVEI